MMGVKQQLTIKSTTTFLEAAAAHSRVLGPGDKFVTVRPRHIPAIIRVLCRPCETRVDIILLHDIYTPMFQLSTQNQIFGWLDTLLVVWLAVCSV